MNKLNLNIPEKSLWYLFVCAGIIALIVLIAIFPMHKINAHKSDHLNRLENQIAAQKDLGPIHLMLTKTMENKKELTLSNPAQKAISREEATKFPDIFKEMAEKSGLRMLSITPDLTKLSAGQSSLVYNAVARGDFANFRKLLIGLGEIPYLEKIEEISVKQLSDSMELQAIVWLKVSGS